MPKLRHGNTMPTHADKMDKTGGNPPVLCIVKACVGIVLACLSLGIRWLGLISVFNILPQCAYTSIKKFDFFLIKCWIFWIFDPGTTPIAFGPKFYAKWRYKCVRSSHMDLVRTKIDFCSCPKKKLKFA